MPDPIYLAKRADRATLLVRGLLQGPSFWLSPAVKSAFPKGVELTPRGVRVVGGQAVVDLSKPAGLATRDQQNRFGAQLVRTLAQLQVSSVTVTVEGKASPLTDLEVDKVVTPPPEPDAYGLRDGLLYALPSIGTDDADGAGEGRWPARKSDQAGPTSRSSQAVGREPPQRSPVSTEAETEALHREGRLDAEQAIMHAATSSPRRGTEPGGCGSSTSAEADPRSSSSTSTCAGRKSPRRISLVGR